MLLATRIPISLLLNHPRRTWTRTRSARNIHTDPGIAVIGLDASITVVPGCGVAAIDAGAVLRVAGLGVTVALASLTVREVPEARLALAAGSTVGIGAALAPASLHVAEIVQGTDAVAIAGNATLWAEAVGAGRATIASSPNDIGLAGAYAAIVLAEQAV